MTHQMQAETDLMTPAELLPVFYDKHNLGDDGGLSNSLVRIDVTKRFHFYMPNYDARRDAVFWHDIHHLVTGYSASSFLGECEISAWEIASGCGRYWAAFIIDTSGVALGIFIHPKKIIQAYARGRKTRSLYHDFFSREYVMNTPVRELKSELMLDKYPMQISVSVRDKLHLIGFLLFAGIYSVFSLISIPLLLLFNLWLVIRRKY